ncbi:MAG: T9SS type A sorting domain-containing protein [Bacteroidia bacterium]|nr:T9SS type A sorting domain-containing protein [Bacteroidia bacterium]
MKTNIFLLFALIAHLTGFADRFRAGEITYRNLDGLSYEITVTTYTDLLDSADVHDSLMVYCGDGTCEIIPRIEKIYLPTNQSVRNIYFGQHTYPGPGTYLIFTEDTFRTSGIMNIPNSGSTGFYIECQITISSVSEVNNSPVFMNIPLDRAYVDSVFIYNPEAYDSDGDSISYKLIACRGSGIIEYSLPSASNIFSLDSFTGDLLWDSPVSAGDYNIAMLIEEFRNGIKIGHVVRDMQVHVISAVNIENLSYSPGCNIFPNPSHDRINLNSKADKWTSAEIVDLSGRTVLSDNSLDVQSIDISGLSVGIYFLRLTDGQGIITRKIVKE